MSLFVFAEITPKPEHHQDARGAILEIVSQTRDEPGCVSFDVFDNVNDNTICLFEEWEDQAALDAHYRQPYTAAVFASYETWLARQPSIAKLSRIS